MAGRREILPPLHRAVRDGDVRKVRIRLAAKDDVNSLAEGYSMAATACAPLFIAVGNQDKNMMKILLDAGADASAVTEPDGRSLLLFAAGLADLEVPKILLQGGARIDDVDRFEGSCALHIAAKIHHVRMLDVLASAGAAVDMANRMGETALLIVARQGSEDCVRALLNAGADPLKTNDRGQNALHMSAKGDVDGITNAGRMLMCTVRKSDKPSVPEHAKIVRLLLEVGLDPNVADRNGVTPLMLASDLAVVKVLLNSGASALALDLEGNSVLHYTACMGCNSGVICMLYKYGADPSLCNPSGFAPARLARVEGHHATAQLLDMLATKYREKEAFEANERRATAVPSEGLTELDDKMKVVVLDSESKESTRVPVEAEAEQFGEEVEPFSESTQERKEGKQHKVLQPCLHCQTLTHRRCARCKTTFFCSRDCQMATMAEHKPICLQIYEEKERIKAERKAKEEEA